MTNSNPIPNLDSVAPIQSAQSYHLFVGVDIAASSATVGWVGGHGAASGPMPTHPTHSSAGSGDINANKEVVRLGRLDRSNRIEVRNRIRVGHRELAPPKQNQQVLIRLDQVE